MVTLLRVERPSIHDNFFALGGHSLMAAQVIARVRQTLGVELPLRAMFEAPTIAQFAELIESNGGPRPASWCRPSRGFRAVAHCHCLTHSSGSGSSINLNPVAPPTTSRQCIAYGGT